MKYECNVMNRFVILPMKKSERRMYSYDSDPFVYRISPLSPDSPLIIAAELLNRVVNVLLCFDKS
jgi:hypothetical protein